MTNIDGKPNWKSDPEYHGNPSDLPTDLMLVMSDKDWVVSPGGGISIPAWIRNFTKEILEVEYSITGIPEEWIESGSKQVLRILPGKPYELTIKISPPAYPECNPGEYPVTIRAHVKDRPEINRKVFDQLVIAANVIDYADPLLVLLAKTEYPVTPGEDVVIPLTIINRDTGTKIFSVNVTGLPREWVKIQTPNINIEHKETAYSDIVIKVPRSPDTKAIGDKFKVEVSYLSGKKKVEIPCELKIKTFSRFSASLSEKSVLSGETWEIRIKNEGNAVDEFQIQFESQKNDLKFKKGEVTQSGRLGDFVDFSDEDTFPLDFGKPQPPLYFRAYARRHLIGPSTASPFRIWITSKTSKDRRPLDGKVVIRPLIPMWVVLTMLFFALSAMLAPIGSKIIRDNNARATLVMATKTELAHVNETATFWAKDNDGDGLSNAQETEIGTNRDKQDSDDDGYSDGEEIRLRTSGGIYGCIQPIYKDSDADGVGDKQDSEPCSNPTLTALVSTQAPAPTQTLPPTQIASSTPNLIVNFIATPSTVKPGATISLKWSIRVNANVIPFTLTRINPDNSPTPLDLKKVLSGNDGTYINYSIDDILPNKAGTYTYLLTVSGPGGQDTKFFGVTVAQ